MATLNMCLSLAKTGNRVTVLAISTIKHPSKVEQIPYNIRTAIEFDFKHIDLKTSIFGGIANFLLSRYPYNIQRYIKKSFKELITRYLQTNTYDIVQLEGLYLEPYIRTVRRAFQGKIAMRTHNVENHIWRSLARDEKILYKRLYFNVLSRRLARLEKRLNKRVDALVAISEPDRQWFLSHNLTKPSITIHVGYFKKNQQNHHIEQMPPWAFAYIGALDWIPNYDGLIWFIDWIWPHIQAEIPEAEFHIAGRNAQIELAERLIAERKIIFHGQVVDSSEYICAFPIMVVPLLSGSGLRVKIVEGMFLGRAIVCTSAAIAGIDVKDRQHVLIADTPDQFADRVIELIQNPELVRELMTNAMNYASTHYDAINLAAKLTNFYTQLTA